MKTNIKFSDFSISDEDLAKLRQRLETKLPILPLRNTVGFPFTVVPLTVGITRSVKLVEDAVKGDRLIGLVAMKDPNVKEPQPGQIYETGTIAKIEHMTRTSDDSLVIIVHGLARFRIRYWEGDTPYLRANGELVHDAVEPGVELEAFMRNLRQTAREVIDISPHFPKEAAEYLGQIKDPRQLTYLISANAGLNTEMGQKILETASVKEKMKILTTHLSREKEVLSIGQKIRSEAKGNMDKAQREFYLRQQLKAIKKELGETDEADSEIDAYTLKLEDAGAPAEAMQEAQRELKRMAGMSPNSAEYTVIKTYLDWMVDLPWKKLSEDQSDIKHSRSVLDKGHYGLNEVKERIIEYLAVRNRIRERKKERERQHDTATENQKTDDKPDMGVILCFTGPPGVGKTSLGQSIAQSLGREFTRMSLGGMRDEAEIRGHRRTYIGAMPGRIIQAIKRAGTRNPVFMLDEVDKIGNDWRGDPSSALLEVLDPAQNSSFRDHYLDVDFDLSEVMFITTANQLETIPAPLRDRMEIIGLDGYTESEKVQIAKRHLVPRQIKSHELTPEEVSFSDDALQKIVRDYTREAGVRNLERQIGAICRKSVVKIAEGEQSNLAVDPDTVREYLKKEKFEYDRLETMEIPGIATGLAVTAFGGDILFIEATRMKGTGKLSLTGQLGDVMRESAQIAHSYIRSQAECMGINPELFDTNDVHLHVPAGAIPKDGPSAGVAMVMALAGLFTGKPLPPKIGMTGEATLRGRVLPVGGIKMKLLAAHRAGLSKVILPKRNEKDLDDLPDDVREAMDIVLVEGIDEAFGEAFGEKLA
jgi:ATP-dependent Lon protease